MCEEMCRLCLSKANLMPLFINIEDNGHFSHVLFLATGLKIEANDGFPQNICETCKTEVNSALYLRNKSQQTERKLIDLGYRRNCDNIVISDENIVKSDEITQVTENHTTTEEIDEGFHHNCEFPELKVEIEFDRLEQDGGDTKWPLNGTIKKLSRKERRQQYLDMVDGTFNPEGPVKCKICQKSVRNWKCFISHAKLHLGFNFVCEFCGKSFISTTQLKRHCRSYHGMSRELRCTHCSYLALDNAQLKIEANDGFPQNICETCKTELHERRLHTLERPFACDQCGSSYHSRRCLVQHIESHRTVAAVQCELCPQAFKSARQLSRHRYRAHKQTNPQAIKFCSDGE